MVALGVGLPCWLWPSFKYRFLAGLLPLLIMLAAIAAFRIGRSPRWTVCVVVGVFGFWGVQWWLTGSPAKYYAFDLDHQRDYGHMRAAAEVLSRLPPGPVLSFPDALDGGIEAAYWHGHAFVSARGFSEDKLARLARDFHTTYALLSPDRRSFVESCFPRARLLHAGPEYLVYVLADSPTGAMNTR